MSRITLDPNLPSRRLSLLTPLRPPFAPSALALSLAMGMTAAIAQAEPAAPASPAGTTTANAAGATSATPATTTPTTGALDAVVVVGSRAGDATLFKSAAPVALISAQQLADTGAATLSQALQALVPSFHFPTSAASSNAASFVKGVSLRGLATDETLVLVNGKRRHATAQLNAATTVVGKGAQSVDLNSIPFSAIDRVEVLLDGASAQYGSDAIAGAINIVLKERNGGGSLSAQLGQNASGDGFSRSAEGNWGFTLPQDGFLTLAFDAWKVNSSYLADTDTRQMYFAGDARESTYPNRNWFYGSGGSERANLVVNAESGIDASTRFYGFASYGWRKDHGFGNLRQPSADQNVRALYPDGFQPFLDIVSRDLSATAGLKFGETASTGRFDLSATHGRNRVESLVFNTLNASLGTNSPRSFSTGDLLNEQTSVNLDYVKPVTLSWLPRPLNVSAGLTYRREGYTVYQGDEGSWINGGVPILDGPNAGKVATPGSQGFGGFSPDDAGRSTRNVYGGYLDLETNPTESLKLALALRSEHYSDFGSTSNGRLAARWEFSPAAAWRGSVSTGYRAPSLGQIAYSRTIPNITGGVLQTTRVSRADSALARALGATDLTPEKSRNYSTGLVLKPTANATLSIDAYQIDIRDRIVLSETLTGAKVVAALTAAGFPTYSGLSYFTNGADTRTRGVDIAGTYRLDLAAAGRVDLGLGFNGGHTRITGVKDTPAVLAGSGLSLIGRQARGIIEKSYPDSTLRLSADYQVGRFSANLGAVRYGEYQLLQSNATLDQTFGAQWIANLRLAYRATDRLKLSVGANNLFNSHPDEVLLAARNPTVSKYAGLAPEGGAGAFVYVRADFDF